MDNKLALIVAGMKPKAASSEAPAGDPPPPPDLDVAAQEVLDAVKNGDAAAFKATMLSFIQLANGG